MKIKNKIGCFVMCRTSSSRLPGKALMEIKGKPVIEHIIERAKLMSSADVIVLCTSTDKSDDILESIARARGIKIFRGSLKDVLERLLGAAEQFGVDYFAVYTADNIFCDPGLMDLGVGQMIENNLDFIDLSDDLLTGGAAYCIATHALRRVCKLKRDSDTEYYPKYFKARKDFNIGTLVSDDPIFYNTDTRVTIDYPADLDFARRIFDEFNVSTNHIPLKTILELLKQKPEIARINLIRQKDWISNQKPMKILKTLKIS